MSRFERKFRLSFFDYLVVRDIVAKIGLKDPYMKGNSHYPVFTRYYDTSDFKFFKEKANGDFRHTKIRLRQYNTDFDINGTGFLEAKTKTKEIVRKWRSKIHGYPESQMTIDTNKTNMDNFNAIKYFFERLPLSATVNVFFHREAYFICNQNFPDIRISFDSNLHALPPSSLKMSEKDNRIYPIKLKKPIVCEVKGAYGQLPEFLKSTFIKCNADQKPFSKYASAIQTLYHLTD